MVVQEWEMEYYFAGDTLYVSETAGEFSTAPTGTALIQRVAVVLRKHATLGRIEINVQPRQNSSPNYIDIVGTVSGAGLIAGGEFYDPYKANRSCYCIIHFLFFPSFSSKAGMAGGLGLHSECPHRSSH